MEFCSLDEAFPESNQIARKEERKKAKKCKGPPLTFLEPEETTTLVDPDRPAYRAKPDVPPLNEKTGMYEHAPSDAPLKEPFVDTSSLSDIIARTKDTQKNPEKQKNAFFGANFDNDTLSPTIENFASFTNIVGDDPSYKLQSDFATSFPGAGSGLSNSSGNILPTPSINDVWKPMTPGGANTSFYGDELTRTVNNNNINNDITETKEDYFRKLDRIYSRLDDLEHRRGENTQTEVLLFVMSGLFVLFSMDMLIKKTGNVRILR